MLADAGLAFVLLVICRLLGLAPRTGSRCGGHCSNSPDSVAAGYSLGWVAILWLHGLDRPRARWTIQSEAISIGRAHRRPRAHVGQPEREEHGARYEREDDGGTPDRDRLASNSPSRPWAVEAMQPEDGDPAERVARGDQSGLFESGPHTSSQFSAPNRAIDRMTSRTNARPASASINSARNPEACRRSIPGSLEGGGARAQWYRRPTRVLRWSKLGTRMSQGPGRRYVYVAQRSAGSPMSWLPTMPSALTRISAPPT